MELSSDWQKGAFMDLSLDCGALVIDLALDGEGGGRDEPLLGLSGLSWFSFRTWSSHRPLLGLWDLNSKSINKGKNVVTIIYYIYYILDQ